MFLHRAFLQSTCLLKHFLLQEYDTLDSSNSGGKTSFDSAGSRHVPEKRSRKLSRPKSLTNLVWDLRGTFTSTLSKNQKMCFPPQNPFQSYTWPIKLNLTSARWGRWRSNAEKFEQAESSDAPGADGARAWGEGGEGDEGGKGCAEGEQQQDGNPLPLACCR